MHSIVLRCVSIQVFIKAVITRIYLSFQDGDTFSLDPVVAFWVKSSNLRFPKRYIP